MRVDLDKINDPLRIRHPANVFVNSMSDLFHKSVSWYEVQAALIVMEQTPHIHYLILTKRSERMRAFFTDTATTSKGKWAHAPLQNVTLGVSVENNQALDRITHLQRTPAAQRFVSFEPLLEEVNAMSQIRGSENPIHHAVIGGESGTGARPCQLRWISSLVNQCFELNIKVFVKQLGSNAQVHHPTIDLVRRYRTTSRKGADPAEWPEQLRIREVIQNPINRK